MKFSCLKDKVEYYRSLSDIKLMPKTPVLLMLDGRSFSKMVKKKFELPFDDDFIEAMNYSALELVKEIQGAKIAYVQSDEISIFLSDYDNSESDSWMSYRLCKLLSVPSSIATGAFIDKIREKYPIMPRVQFDCKAWNVPDENNVFAWFLSRQIDCVRNSKQQTAQTWLSHNNLSGLNTDEQIKLLEKTTGIKWEDFKQEYKTGRLIIKKEVTLKNDKEEEYKRGRWETIPAPDFTTEEGKLKFLEYVKR